MKERVVNLSIYRDFLVGGKENYWLYEDGSGAKSVFPLENKEHELIMN